MHLAKELPLTEFTSQAVVLGSNQNSQAETAQSPGLSELEVASSWHRGGTLRTRGTELAQHHTAFLPHSKALACCPNLLAS